MGAVTPRIHLPPQWIFHHKYYTSFIDAHTHYSHITLLRKKDETFESYKHFEAWAATQYNVKIKRLRSDRGGEYLDQDFTAHLQAQGTERRLTTHDTPEHNGVAEALNRWILERVRAMLHQVLVGGGHIACKLAEESHINPHP